jgi:predicted AlkP superfamily phosphohydrolase/phosphomutase
MYKDEVTLDLLYEHLEDVATQHVRASKYLLEKIPDWGFFAHIFTESDRVQHPYWKYFQPEYYQFVDENLVKVHGDKINSIIEKIDSDIGRFLTYLDENTTVVVLSDHGFQAYPMGDTGNHNREGIYIFSGKGVKNPQGLSSLDYKSFPTASVLDITPTILYLMGYSVGKDMDGEVLLNVIDKEKSECCLVQFIDSYDSNFLNKDRAKHTIDESTKDQLKSLGYIH